MYKAKVTVFDENDPVYFDTFTVRFLSVPRKGEHFIFLNFVFEVVNIAYEFNDSGIFDQLIINCKKLGNVSLKIKQYKLIS